MKKQICNIAQKVFLLVQGKVKKKNQKTDHCVKMLPFRESFHIQMPMSPTHKHSHLGTHILCYKFFLVLLCQDTVKMILSSTRANIMQV